MLRHGVMVPYHEDTGFTTEIIGVHTVHASVTFKFDPVENDPFQLLYFDQQWGSLFNG